MEQKGNISLDLKVKCVCKFDGEDIEVEVGVLGDQRFIAGGNYTEERFSFRLDDLVNNLKNMVIDDGYDVGYIEDALTTIEKHSESLKEAIDKTYRNRSGRK
jgi:hypothetical protein